MATNTEPQWYRDLMARDAETGRLDRISIRKNPEPNNIVLCTGSEEMLKIAQDGFYVRGVKVEQDPEEAKHVYEAFKQWLTWGTLTKE